MTYVELFDYLISHPDLFHSEIRFYNVETGAWIFRVCFRVDSTGHLVLDHHEQHFEGECKLSPGSRHCPALTYAQLMSFMLTRAKHYQDYVIFHDSESGEWFRPNCIAACNCHSNHLVLMLHGEGNINDECVLHF